MKAFKKMLILLTLSAALFSGCTSDETTKEDEDVIETDNKTVETSDDQVAETTQVTKEELLASAAGLEGVTFREVDFENVSVHDPSVIKVEDTYYVFGSHLAAAKTEDLIHWEVVADRVRPDNPMFPNVDETLAETLEWAETKTFWAPDVTQLADGRFYFYYCACRGDSPLSALGVAVADDVEGPYEDLGIILKSGNYGQESPDGTPYDATVHPNVVDPHTFFDAEGKLWMIYGSYSGGIFILAMDPETGLPIEGQGFGKKLLGADHARIEGAYVQYSEATGYYYMFLSFGGLDVTGGYNIRVARSEHPDGPYYDSEGKDMINCIGNPNQIFYDPDYEPYGYKVMGNFQFAKVAGEPGSQFTGYISPGHNSSYYEATTDQYFLIFHSRFANRGDRHEVRVHQYFFNEDGWPVVLPYRYTGETISPIAENELYGSYKFINHGHDISADMKYSSLMRLNADGSVDGDVTGTWSLSGDYDLTMTLDDVTYTGICIKQYDENNGYDTITFTLGSELGVCVWGSLLHIDK